MSRLARKPIVIDGATIIQKDGALSFKGPKGERQIKVLPYTQVTISGQSLNVTTEKSLRQARANVGTMWALVRNALEGVTKGFFKVLEIEGVGYRAAIEDKTLVLSLGFVNPIRFESPSGITLTVEKNQITVSGIDKELVGQVAAEIRAFKKPEPYKGKGIRYQNEVIRRKAGKKAVASS